MIGRGRDAFRLELSGSLLLLFSRQLLNASKSLSAIAMQ